ncbi:MAG: hypothetical protein KKB50_04535 [Planctomycetes bacterium]|nr:hypothetical protein [Planctomycetota bacterium]
MRSMLIVTLALWTAATVSADPFYLRYDPDEGRFPEQEGWTRHWDDPQQELIRSVEGGIFQIDSRGSAAIYDYYSVHSTAFDLADDEELRVTWRMQTVETSGSFGRSDVAVTITNGQAAFAKFYLGSSFVSADEYLGGDPEHFCAFAPGSAHTFTAVTQDLLRYNLFVDDRLAFQGSFHDYAWIGPYRVLFGDTTTGRTSLSEWSDFEISVIPEPSGRLLVGSILWPAVLWVRSVRR